MKMNWINKPTVSVLLSSYNGQKYIKELVDSVLTQEEVNVKLQVRDDGSTDDTLKILESYHDSRISIRTGENLKPAKSFLTLLHECDESDYYAYCDQDDVWYPKKLIKAVRALETYHEPALFISTYDVVDKQLKKMFTYDMKFYEPMRLQDTLIYRAPSACNMVFNHEMRKKVNRKIPENARMHDFWTLLVAELHDFPIITLDEPLIKYRQHESNTVSITPTIRERVTRLMKSFTKGDNERWRQAKELYDIYKDEISGDKLDLLKLFVNYRDSFTNRILLFKDKRCVTSNFYINMLFKVSVLLDKF